MVAGAVVRAGHLAVTRVKVAAMTESEAVRRVRTQEVSALGLKNAK